MKGCIVRMYFGKPRCSSTLSICVGANPLVNWCLTLLFVQTNQSAQNKDINVVQIKPKAIASFENVVTSGEIAPTNIYIE